MEISVKYFDKSTILQEARVFNESPLVAKKCRLILSKIIYLIYQGEHINTNEATELFFSITKLFQSKDMSLRQMVYLAIKELSTISEDVIMVTSSLMKDMQPQYDVTYRANAIRALCKIINDPNTLASIERFLKAAIVEKSPSISSAAIISSYHLFGMSKDLIRRWGNEVNEALNFKGSSSTFLSASSSTTSSIVQYHALGLIYSIKSHDRMAVMKLISNFSGKSSGFFSSGNTLKNPLATCLLIRYAVKVMEDDVNARSTLVDLLEGFLRHKSDMVSLEAARAICNLDGVDSKELHPAVSALQLFLSSSKASLRFSAIRTLNMLAIKHPEAVSSCNLDMENLISDTNRSVATYAITTLLKTGNENSVDRLMKQIISFISDISDEFKVIVTDAIRSLTLKFPTKYPMMLTFLSNVLRDEGGYEFKKSVIEAIFDLVKFIPDCRDVALSHLAEFIEDCEFSKLSVRVLNVLGNQGPKTTNPTMYIRYIYNRVVLEKPIIRASAVQALSKFGSLTSDSKLKNHIRVLLERCLNDSDDEVRDRACWGLRLIEDEDSIKKFIKDDSVYSLPALERSLYEYYTKQSHETPFNISQIPKISKAQQDSEELLSKQSLQIEKSLQPTETKSSAPSIQAKKGTSFEQFMSTLSSLPQFQNLGSLFKSSKPIQLSESETEYVVSCIKHIFDNGIVFQFECKNTVQDCILENVTMDMSFETESTPVYQASTSLDKLAFDDQQSIAVIFQKDPEDPFPYCTFSNTMKFLVKDCDPNTGEVDETGFSDEYTLEAIELSLADYILPSYLGEFPKVWKELGETNQVVETFTFSAFNSLQNAISSLLDLLGMKPVDNTDQIKSTSVHTLLLSGIFYGGIKSLARVRMGYRANQGVTMEISVRSESEEASQIIMSVFE